MVTCSASAHRVAFCSLPWALLPPLSLPESPRKCWGRCGDASGTGGVSETRPSAPGPLALALLLDTPSAVELELTGTGRLPPSMERTGQEELFVLLPIGTTSLAGGGGRLQPQPLVPSRGQSMLASDLPTAQPHDFLIPGPRPLTSQSNPPPFRRPVMQATQRCPGWPAPSDTAVWAG